MASINTGEDNSKIDDDNEDNDLGDKLNESSLVESEAHGEKLDSNVESSDLSKMNGNSNSDRNVVELADLAKFGECKDLESKGGEKLDEKNEVVDTGDETNEDRDIAVESEAHREKIDSDVENSDLGKMNGISEVVELADSAKVGDCKDLESKGGGENLDEKNEVVDAGDKLNEDRDIAVESEAHQKKLDSSVECYDLGKINGNSNSDSQVVELADSAKVGECKDLGSIGGGEKLDEKNEVVDSGDEMKEDRDISPGAEEETNHEPGGFVGEKEDPEPVFDGVEVPGVKANRSTSRRSSNLGPDPDPGPEPEVEGAAWPDKAVAFKNLVKEKGAVAVGHVFSRLYWKKDETGDNVSDAENKVGSDSAEDNEAAEVSQRRTGISLWNRLKSIARSSEVDAEYKTEVGEDAALEPIVMKGRILLYTRLGCENCKEARLFLYHKRLRYVEINIDIYPGRKGELEKISGSSAVPKVFFNEILIGGLSDLKGLAVSGRLDEKIEYLITETPSFEAPLPPLSGEDDVSCSGAVDELAVIVCKMKKSVAVKDRFYKMRRFTNCFVGSEAVDFLSEDQYLEREEAVEFGRKFARKLFFRHVLDENLFEDSNDLYRFLDHEPVVSSQCYNIPRGIIDVKPKPISEIASRLRLLVSAILEAYTSEDGRHVDYRSIHGSEEYARYLRIVEELQRVEMQAIPREEKLAFFINLYNMMIIHGILVLGYPEGALERRILFGDFKYVIGGCTYSLSAIQNGILRCNQRPPYNLMKPFTANDSRLQVALPYLEPLIHFALVSGNRSSPTLRCYSPKNVDKELMDAARDFLRGGDFTIDFQGKVASISKIFKWFSSDFGKNEEEVLKHVSNYLEPTISASFLELLGSSQLKVIYQPYDWAPNC